MLVRRNRDCNGSGFREKFWVELNLQDAFVMWSLSHPFVTDHVMTPRTSKLIDSSDAPNPKDHIISAHALTSVSAVVHSSRNQPKTHEIQSEVVESLVPHLEGNFGDQSHNIGPKDSILSILVYSGECRLFSIPLLYVSHVDIVLQTIKVFWKQTAQGGTPPSPQLSPWAKASLPACHLQLRFNHIICRPSSRPLNRILTSSNWRS